MKRARIVFTNDAFRELMKLPENVRVLGVVETDQDRQLDQVTVLLEGEGLPKRCLFQAGFTPLAVDPFYSHKIYSETVFLGFDPPISEAAKAMARVEMANREQAKSQ